MIVKGKMYGTDYEYNLDQSGKKLLIKIQETDKVFEEDIINKWIHVNDTLDFEEDHGTLDGKTGINWLLVQISYKASNRFGLAGIEY